MFYEIDKIVSSNKIGGEKSMLSPFIFIKNNKKIIRVILLILAISVLTVDLSTTLISSIYDTCYEVGVRPFSKYTVIYSKSNDNLIKAEVVDKIQSDEKVQRIYNVTVEGIQIKTVFGTTTSNIYFLNNETDLNDMCQKIGLSLKEGRMPKENECEIALHINVAKNKKIKIGDYVGKYLVVGLLKGDSQISVGSFHEKYKEYLDVFEKTPLSILILPNEKVNITDMNDDIKDMDLKNVKIYGWGDANSDLEDEFSNINIILYLIIIMIALSLSIAVAALAFSIYSNRYDEFGILYALGYRKSKIKHLIFQEVLLISGIGWGIGYLVSAASLIVVDKLVYSNMGQTMRVITLSGSLQSLIIPGCMFLFTIYPVLRKLKKTDLITIIERR